MIFPPTAPAWVVAALDELAGAGRLSGVPPEVLAAICRFTSNYGQPSLAVNPEGFGGYLGQHVGWTYPSVSGAVTFTLAELLDPVSFTAEAEAAAATLASYNQPLGQALLTYSGGAQSFVTFVCETTGASPSLTFSPVAPTNQPTKPPKEDLDDMHWGIQVYENAQWAIIPGPTGLRRAHVASAADVAALRAQGAVTVAYTEATVAAMPTVTLESNV